MQPQDYPILEFDPNRSALIEPTRITQPVDTPDACVLAIMPHALAKLATTEQVEVVHEIGTGLGKLPVYRWFSPVGEVTLCNPGVGSAFAALRLENLIALGCRWFIVCGSCGVLDPGLAHGHLILPTSAVRDEGASYHYLPPSREVEVDPQALACLERVVRAEGYDPLLAKTWTTDALYRETPARVAARRAEGCLTVEMEAAALFAVAQFRQVALAQILWAADDVSGDEWDPRGFGRAHAERHSLLELASMAALALQRELGDAS